MELNIYTPLDTRSLETLRYYQECEPRLDFKAMIQR